MSFRGGGRGGFSRGGGGGGFNRGGGSNNHFRGEVAAFPRRRRRFPRRRRRRQRRIWTRGWPRRLSTKARTKDLQNK
ncbi:hypothetical protein QTO34_008126 [Cnephaeus nilssonii]|uniref:Uncharacterized protein n=1 Tax=Cnephaeus nilssonii TaxID=3371016 RepID=A0AA40LVX5_CNENI|nr:hypothetical protein QTO34_008126 [Eptesicus nilssonii]